MVSPLIAITQGDYNGVGPEVILRSFSGMQNRPDYMPVIIGSQAVMDYYARRLGLKVSLRRIASPEEAEPGQVCLMEPDEPPEEADVQPGESTAASGSWAMKAVRTATRMAMDGRFDGMVTAPISKEGIRQAGYTHPGHTEYLSELTGCENTIMTMISGRLRIGLVTAHMPLREVPGAIRSELIEQRSRTLHRSLRQDFGIPAPRIAVLGLNPHAGDGGVLGHEESEIIAPAMERLQSESIAVEGPFAADGFFGTGKTESYDAVLAMYHDQGLAPFKALCFNKGINFTAGLPVIRCSPDHGTAYDIAGLGKADPGSLLQAILLAVKLATLKAGVRTTDQVSSHEDV